MSNEINTRNAKIWKTKEGIVKVVYRPGTEETLEDAETNLSALQEFSRGERLPVFINPNSQKSMSRDARLYYIKNTRQIASAVAVLRTSPFSHILSIFLLVLNKTMNNNLFSLRFFTSEDMAMDWLKNYKA
ncbi:MAG: hypothetical protein OEV78_10085 [Spirochaetia bacterium]|nr:hypothetical protein [Spirochaetia bacterium]